MKFCEDCKWFQLKFQLQERLSGTLVVVDTEAPLCNRPIHNEATGPPVRRKPIAKALGYSAWMERAHCNDTSCGPDGRYWEAK